MSNLNLGPISQYSNTLVNKTREKFHSETNFHQLMRNGSLTIHLVANLVENFAALIKEGIDSIVNSQAVHKLNEKVLIPTSQKILEIKDAASAKANSLYNHYTK